MRYVIIDYMPLVHKYINGAPPLTHTVNIGGSVETIETTVPNYTMKHIVRCGGNGAYAVAVCLEGGSSWRKEYFSAGGTEYKGGRKPLFSNALKGANITIDCLTKAGVSCYRRAGYEADDWIYTIVKMLKAKGITDPIDIVTVDRDMLPLVDEQVSVYIQAKRQYNEQGCPSISGYYQVTPRSMETYCSYASEYKEYGLTYNTVLLYKLIKGDKSDNIGAAVKGYGKKTFAELMQTLKADGIDTATIFRYGVDFDTVMRPVLERYFKTEQVDAMKYIYGGICLREVPPISERGFVMPKPIRTDLLQIEAAPYGIHFAQR